MKCCYCEKEASFLVPYGEFKEHEISVAFCDECFKEWSSDKTIAELTKEYWTWTKKLDARRPIAGLIG